MALSPAAAPTDQDQGVNAPDLQFFVFALFFIFGGITSLNDIIIPKLKDLFTLSYAQALLVQSAYFMAYLVFSLPAAAVVARFGYMRTASFGLLAMMAGCLMFVPASASGLFPVFLVALFVLAAGVTMVQVVANPLISLLGPPRTAHSRLTFAQAFNSIGTTIFPIVGSALILGSLSTVDPSTLTGAALSDYRTAETQTVVRTYLGLAAALLVVAAVVWTRRNRLPEGAGTDAKARLFGGFDLLRRPRFGFGAACIFLYVGAEVAIGSLIVNYLEQSSVMGLSQRAAGDHVAYYWGGAMVGRIIGAGLLRLVAPGKVLAGVALGAIALLFVSTHSSGAVSGWSLLAIGLVNSVMFPTIFSLASEGLGKRAAEGSGLIATAIVGGAVIPPLTGWLADQSNLRVAMALPALCYALIAAYGWYARRPAV
ncbi:MAG: glucose transporter [Proteobacteria bacterium SG_bin5]|nr:sugar MFS transporter [Sphingomonas sp.]OQW41423.1 MAG: glucose transporter [Proteobacteria bacterium SG_bin5]